MLRQWRVSWGGLGVMVTFLDVARMVDATAMMGVLAWGGGDGNVSWRCTWDNVKKQLVFWNHDDTFSHATWAKSSFRYSGMLIFCPYNVHFLHGREKVGNQVVSILPPFISHGVGPFGKGPTTPGLGDLRSPWLLTTYVRHGMFRTKYHLAKHLLIHLISRGYFLGNILFFRAPTKGLNSFGSLHHFPCDNMADSNINDFGPSRCLDGVSKSWFGRGGACLRLPWGVLGDPGFQPEAPAPSKKGTILKGKP